jgi:hypothetical protein
LLASSLSLPGLLSPFPASSTPSRLWPLTSALTLAVWRLRHIWSPALGCSDGGGMRTAGGDRRPLPWPSQTGLSLPSFPIVSSPCFWPIVHWFWLRAEP